MTTTPFLWLIGPSGVGKSTVAWEIFNLLTTAGTKAAFVDADQLGLCYPAPEDDPANHHIKATNLAAAWNAYHTAGATHLILSGGILHPTEVHTYASALPETALTLCRLRATPTTLAARFTTRGYLLQYLDLTLKEAQALDHASLPATVIETDNLPPRTIAEQICAPTGPWPALPTPRTPAPTDT